MHFVKAKTILNAHNGMNLYRGCQHGCIYCDSRSTCYQMSHSFEDIEVKENALQLLEAALCKKRKKCMIGTGAMSDPYMPLERHLQYTRKALMLIEQYGFGVTILTKSSDVLNDLDLLERISKKTKCVVQMTLTTYDEVLCKKLETHVSTTYERYLALKTLQVHGIPTIVWLDPILPFINDTEENLKGILDYCIDAGVKGIVCFGFGLTLREGNREYFYSQLDHHFPGLSQVYIRRYGNRYEVDSPNHARLMKIFCDTCKKENILYKIDEIFAYLHSFEEAKVYEQLHLF